MVGKKRNNWHMIRTALWVFPIVAVMIVANQNCSDGFGSKTFEQRPLSSLGAGTEPIVMSDDKGRPVEATDDLIAKEDYLLKLSGVKLPADATVSYSAVGSAGARVDIHPSTTVGNAVMQCDVPGPFKLSVSVFTMGAIYNSEPMNLNCVDGSIQPVSPPGATVVTFRIPAGTGTKAWNTAATAVTVFVGQTLRIINDDSIKHRLHTGGAPCVHQNVDSAPNGGTYDCVVTKPISVATLGAYDHNIGTSGRLYVISIDGKALYDSNCVSCHGVLASSEVRNKTFTQIRTAMQTQADMMRLPSLTDDQIRAIEYSLSH